MIIFLIALMLLTILFINLLFCYTVYRTMKQIPESARFFPAWFAWMMGVPVIHLAFIWLMLPFGIPRSINAHFANNAEALRESRALFGLGLALAISLSLLIFFNFVALIVSIVLYILYWVKITQFRKKFSMPTPLC